MLRPEPRDGFWHLLSGSDQSALSDLGRFSSFPAGATMCLEGEPTTHLFVLVSGWVKIVSVTRDGQEVVLALRGNGDIIGEIAGEATGHRTATARTIGRVRSLIVTHDEFDSFLDTHTRADRAYRHVVTQRLNEASAALLWRSTSNGAQRLAGLLVDLANRYGMQKAGALEVEMPLSQEGLASLAGTSRATMARALTGWRRRGLVRTGYRHITIIDIDELQKIARRLDLATVAR